MAIVQLPWYDHEIMKFLSIRIVSIPKLTISKKLFLAKNITIVNFFDFNP
jgi:hypothetical protein